MSFIVKGIKKVVSTVVGVAAKIVGAVFGFSFKKPKAATAPSRLNKSLNPEDFRKIVFGRTASALDIRYWEVYGTSGSQYDEVIAVASHEIEGFLGFYVEKDLAINSSNTPQGIYAGLLSRTFKTGAHGQTALSVGAGGQWTSAAKMTGVAHMCLKWVQDDKKMPNGIPSRYTNVVEGAKLYDPRKDTTVGGSGSHRYDDQSTWEYSPLDGNGVPIGRNNALQMLFYLIGWRVQNPDTSEWVLTCGRGLEIEDINIASFITAANDCETEGYYTDMVLSTEDSHTSNEERISADGLIGTVIDAGGVWAYYANVDDTANIAVELTDSDILDIGTVKWNDFEGMSDQFNQVVGKFIDPSASALYQDRAYPIVRDVTYETALGVKRRKTQDFSQIQDSLLAQKLARLKLNQGQFQAELQASFGYRAVKAQAWSIVRYTSDRFGWVKLFRVWRQGITMGQGVTMTLKEVDPSIWTPGSVTASPDVPTILGYDVLQEVNPANLVATAQVMTGGGDSGDGFKLSWDSPPPAVKSTEFRYRVAGTTEWESLPTVSANITSVISPILFSGAIYEIQARHVTTHDIEGDWTSPVGGDLQLGVNGSFSNQATAFPPGIKIGVLGDVKLTKNYSTSGPNNGEIRVEGTAIFLPDFGKRTLPAALSELATRFEGTYNGGTFYVIAGSVAAATRFGSAEVGSPPVEYFFSAKYDWATGDWTVYDNAGATFPYTPIESDAIIAVGTKIPATTGITTLVSLIDYWADLPDDNADVTGDNVPTQTGPTIISFNADHTGTIPAEQLNVSKQARRFQGMTDVTTSSAWSIVSPSGCAVSIGASTGVWTISSCASSGSFIVRSIYGASTIDVIVTVTKNFALPPSPVGLIATATNLNDFGSSGVHANVSGNMTVTTGSNGRIDFTAPLTISTDFTGPTGSSTFAGKWRWRAIGGSFSDVSAEITGTYPLSVSYDAPIYDFSPGSIEVTQAKTGLIPDTQYEVELQLRRKTGSGTRTFYSTGTATAIGS